MYYVQDNLPSTLFTSQSFPRQTDHNHTITSYTIPHSITLYKTTSYLLKSLYWAKHKMASPPILTMQPPSPLSQIKEHFYQTEQYSKDDNTFTPHAPSSPFLPPASFTSRHRNSLHSTIKKTVPLHLYTSLANHRAPFHFTNSPSLSSPLAQIEGPAASGDLGE